MSSLFSLGIKWFRCSMRDGKRLIVIVIACVLIRMFVDVVTVLEDAQRPGPSELIQSDPELAMTEAQRSNLQNMSSVDYFACCGAGHRLSKIVDANYLAKKLGYSLRTFWGYCDNVEVFHHLFGPQPAEEVIGQVTHDGTYVRLSNEVPHFNRLIRQGPQHPCPCSMDLANETIIFYRSLRDRFVRRDIVDDFMKHHRWANKTIVGMHIRAGNGETGDFQGRGRPIQDAENWLQRVVNHLVASRPNWTQPQRPNVTLFIATDTPSMITKVQDLLRDHDIPVLHYEQKRREEGSGVMFGEHGRVVNNGSDCILGWENTFVDMMLLSHADIVVAARPSSFTQSLPMSLVLVNEEESPSEQGKQFCEMNPQATEMHCFRDYADWCCNGTTEFILKDIQIYDYIKTPPVELSQSNSSKWREMYRIQRRPSHSCQPRFMGWPYECLPSDW